MWRQHELSDGTYDLHDLIQINRVLDIQDENRRRAAEAAKAKSANRS